MTDPAGIDVSNIQGARYDWPQWRGKIGFGMCKASEGLTFTDPDFADNWNAMWELDRLMPRFGYHYFHPAEDPVSQAQLLVSTVKEHGLLPGDNLVADFETTDSLPVPVVAAAGVRFLRAVNDLAPGHRVLPYMSPSFAEAGNSAGMGSWYLWVADYGVLQPAVPPPWKAWTFWQRGDSPVDTDVFNGDQAALLSFCRMPAAR